MDELPASDPPKEVDITVSEKKKTSKAYVDPPLFSFSISNPVNYLRKWWYRVISREGIDVKFRIHPVTAFAILATIASLGFGLGRFTVPDPIIKLVPQLAPTPTPDPWRETAYSGILQVTKEGKYYLITPTSAEAVTLEVPLSVNLSSLIGKRIFASGKYNTLTKVLVVTDATTMEILLKVAPVVSPSPTPISTPISTPSATSSATASGETSPVL